MSSRARKRKADDALTVSADVLECSVCCERFDAAERVPRSLVCGHHFCAVCLAKLLLKSSERNCIKCPKCKTDTGVADGNVSLLPKTYVVADMVDEAARRISTATTSSSSSSSVSSCALPSGDEAQCELCEESHAATHHCRECQQSMCDFQSKCHRRMSGTMQHHVVPLAELKDGALPAPPLEMLCKEHGEKITLFDLKCRQTLCSHCVPAHGDHGTQIKLLSEAAPLCRAELASWSARIEQWERRTQATVEQCATRGQEVSAQKVSAAAKIEAAYQNVKAALDARRTLLLNQLSSAETSKTAALQRQVTKWQGELQRAATVRARLQAATTGAHESDIGCVSAYASLVAELDAMQLPAALAGAAAASVLEAPSATAVFRADVDASGAVAAVGAMGSVGSDTSLTGVFVHEIDLGANENVVFTADGQFYVGISSTSVHGKQTIKVCCVADRSVVRKFGGDQLKCPIRIALSRDGHVVVSDTQENCLFVYRLAEGAFVRQIGSSGSAPGQFNEPWGMAVSKSGLVFVADSENHRIQVVKLSDGSLVRSFGSKGSGDGQFGLPTHLCLSVNETELFVSDTWNHRIQVFDLEGRFLRKWGTQGAGQDQFNQPHSVISQPLGEILVTDSLNHRMQVFGADGTFLRSFGQTGDGAAKLERPLSASLSPTGELFVQCAGSDGRYSVYR